MAFHGFGPEGLPVRVAIVTVGGAPTDLVLSLHHGTGDETAARVVAAQIRRLAIDPDATLPGGWNPREIAAFESSPEGRRLAEDADAQDRAALRACAMPPLNGPNEGPDGIIYNVVLLNSPAVVLAAAALAARTRVTMATILLAAYIRALANHFGLDRCAVNVVVSNRHTAQTRAAVAHLVGKVLLAVETGGGVDSFPDLCRATSSALLRAARFGLHDPDLYHHTVAQAAAELGHPVDNPFSRRPTWSRYCALWNPPWSALLLPAWRRPGTHNTAEVAGTVGGSPGSGAVFL